MEIDVTGTLSFTSGKSDSVQVDIENQVLREKQDILRMTKNEISLTLEQMDEDTGETISVRMSGKLRIKGGGSSAKLKFMPVTELADHPELCRMLEGDVRAVFKDPQTRIDPDEDKGQGRLG